MGIINNASNNVVAMRWSGSAWVSASINPLGTVAETFWWTADVAYEQTSGDAVMVWGNGTSLQYSEWNGTSWTAKTTISPTPLAGTIKTVRLASKPGSNEIVAAVATTAGHYALVWNGSSWGNGQSLDNTAQTDYTDIYCGLRAGYGSGLGGLWQEQRCQCLLSDLDRLCLDCRSLFGSAFRGNRSVQMVCLGL